MKKIQFPLSVALLVVMIFVWKNVFDKYIFHNKGQSSFLVYKNSDDEAVAEAMALTVLNVQGNVSLSNGAQKTKVKIGQVINQPGNIITDSESMLQLGYGSGYASKIKISANSNFHISRFYEKGFKTNDGLFFDLQSGVILFKIYNPSKRKILRVRTPHFTLAIRGTTFMVEANEEKSVLLVHEGTVELESKSGKGKLIHAGFGLSGKDENDLDQIQVANYHLEWNAESAASTPPQSTAEVKVASSNMIQATEEEIVKMTSALEERRERNLEHKRVLDKDLAEVDLELHKLTDDVTCLDHMMKDCEFISTKFKDDVANLKNHPTNLSKNPAIKINLLKEFSQERSRVEKIKADLLAELEQDQKDLQNESDKIALVRTKLNEIQNANNETKNKELKEIVELIDSKSIREAAQKSDLYKN